MKLSKTSGNTLSDPQLYHSVGDALQCATLTRPDLSFAVNNVCQSMQMPANNHWQSMKRILEYIKKTLSYGLLLSQSS